MVEPDYKNKYPPMGLMKLATYYKKLGDSVRFFKGDLRDLAAALICEDLLAVLHGVKPDVLWEKYIPPLQQYIRFGKMAEIPDNPLFNDAFVMENIKLSRQKYKEKNYFENPRFDVVCITTLFTFYWNITIDTINFVKRLCKNPEKVFVGGIMASILPDVVERETGVRPYIGVLDRPGIYDAGNKLIIDTLPLDYSILDEIEYKYPTVDAYYGYMTRGCPNRCSFCAVPTLEPQFIKYIPIKRQIEETAARFGEQKDLLLLDNNVLYSSRFDQIIDEIKECGFAKGAAYLPPNQYEITIKNLRDGINDYAYIKKCVALYHDLLEKCKKWQDIYFELYNRITGANCYYDYTATSQAILALDGFIAPLYAQYVYKPRKRRRYVDFNQGVDARLIVKYPERMRKLSEICVRPLRIAFDSWALRDIYEKAVCIAVESEVKNLSNYLLYNSDGEYDTPVNLFYRMRLNVDLCEKLDVSIYSFPMKYHPINNPEYFRNRDYIGKHWNRKFIRAIQAVLNSTKGKIGRGKTFFAEAFGRDADEFQKILFMPEMFIIYRRRYDKGLMDRLKDEYTGHYADESDLTNEWWEKFRNLNEVQYKQAAKIISENNFTNEVISMVKSSAVKDVLSYYFINRGSSH
ncbi:MAG: hypothetical protein LBK66_13570 [Spirochaetaceae bacterium]|nr:hypothetical protein [Spirochaetaceae bacterium]